MESQVTFYTHLVVAQLIEHLGEGKFLTFLMVYAEVMFVTIT